MIQIESMDERLKTGLWNTFVYYLPYLEKYDLVLRRVYGLFFSHPLNTFPIKPKLPESTYERSLHQEQFKKDITKYKERRETLISVMKTSYDQLQWFEVYDFIEFVVNEIEDEKSYKNFVSSCNKILKSDNAGYRLVDNKILPITDVEELSEIEKVLENPIDGVKEHIKQAINLFSDREKPDYRNTIKESISAVESMCRIVSGKPNATLGDALNIIEKSDEVELHPALKSAFSKLYGWTSDKKSGIRHGIMDIPNLSDEDARFMLIACSAFINYLTKKAIKAGISLLNL